MTPIKLIDPHAVLADRTSSREQCRERDRRAGGSLHKADSSVRLEAATGAHITSTATRAADRRGDPLIAAPTWPEGLGPAELQAAALAYAEAGWRVFPIRAGTKRPHPTLARTGFKVASSDPEQVHEWWRRDPFANIGFATGLGIAVLDVDLHKGAELDASWPETLTSRTANGGLHRYYRVEGCVPISAGRLGPGLDVRGDGGYVLLPPSRLLAGRSYVWERLSAPATLEAARLRGGGVAVSRDGERLRSKHAGALPKAWRPWAPRERIPVGERHDELVRAAGWLRRQGCAGDELEALLFDYARRCKEPLGDDEVLAIARWAGRLER